LVTTFDGFEIIVPNQKFLTSSVINYTGEDKLYRTKLDIKVDYDSDTKKIQEILTRILQDNPHCHSRSRTGIKDFSESGYIFRVEIWVDCTSVGFTPLYDSIIVMIRDEFEKHNIKFYIPKRVVIRP
jgi:small-conductance mechanosensitive channel